MVLKSVFGSSPMMPADNMIGVLCPRGNVLTTPKPSSVSSQRKLSAISLKFPALAHVQTILWQRIFKNQIIFTSTAISMLGIGISSGPTSKRSVKSAGMQEFSPTGTGRCMPMILGYPPYLMVVHIQWGEMENSSTMVPLCSQLLENNLPYHLELAVVV